MMMQVWNDNTKEYVEELDGEIIKIPAKGFIELPLGKGKKLLRTYVPMEIDGVGNHKNPKMLRGEYPQGRYKVKANEDQNKSMLTGETFKNATELLVHALQNSQNLVSPEEVLKEAKKAAK